jgi:hypothetical protein
VWAKALIVENGLRLTSKYVLSLLLKDASALFQILPLEKVGQGNSLGLGWAWGNSLVLSLMIVVVVMVVVMVVIVIMAAAVVVVASGAMYVAFHLGALLGHGHLS